MPNPARLVVYGTDNKPLAGPLSIADPANADLAGSDIHEFSHQVYTIEKDYLYSLLYGIDFIRQHTPLLVVKPVDVMSVPLMSFLLKGTFLPKVEIRFYTYLEDCINLQEYFRITMEHVRLHNKIMHLPDAKDQKLERYAHLEYITFCYQKITWLYNKGTLQFTDIWNGGFFAEEDEKDFGGKKRDEIEEPAAESLIEALKIKFTSGVFEEPADGFQFDKKATVKFTYETNRKPDNKENKVYVKLFAVYSGKTEDLHLTNEGRLVGEGSWSTEFKLKRPEAYEKDTERKADAVVEYYAEIENQAAAGSFKGESVSVPKKDTTAPEFVEIYFENENGEKIENVAKNKKVLLVVVTKNMVGEKVEIDLSDGKIDFEYNGQLLGNDLLKDLEVTEDTMKIELVTHAQGSK